MGRRNKRSRSRSSSSSDYEDRRKSRKEIKKRDARIQALEGLVRDLRKNNYNYHNISNTPCPSNASEVAATLPVNETSSSSFNAMGSTMIRYVGRNDFIPEFDPQKTTIPIEHWLRNLEAIGRMHGWDERSIICNCTAKLAGYAKDWYERQTCYDIDWKEWKEKLIKAFPYTRNKLSQIRELVNRVRLPNEDPIKFYYEKLGIGMSCNMTEEVITEAIIGTLGDKLMEVGAVSAGCQDTRSLLKHLASMKTSLVHVEEHSSSMPLKFKSDSKKRNNCFSCGKKGHVARHCSEKKCNYCSRLGHIEVDCYRKKNNFKKCSYCHVKGHTLEECRKCPNKSDSINKSQNVKKIQMVSSDSSDKKYFKEVLINEVPTNAFVDFGSSCNTIRKTFCDKLYLQQRSNESVVIKGFGDAITLPLGLVTAKLTVDGIQSDSDFYVVPDHVQEVNILVGQPFTESKNIVVVKTSSQLNFYNSDILSSVSELCEDINKIKLYPCSDISLKPGLNKVIVRTEPVVNGFMKLRHSEHREPSFEKDILTEEVDSCDGQLIIKVVNKTNKIFELKESNCIARADLIESKEIKFKYGSQLSNEEIKSLEHLLKEFEHCFSGDGMELGNCDIEMTIKLTENKVISYKPYRMSYYEREVVRKIVAELLSAGIIEESQSPYASPVLLVKKKEGGYRMCVDYRALNKITEKERYPLPIIQDLLDMLVDKKVFCCLDLANSYHQIKINESSRPLTGFVTQDGHYQYRMMSFGLCNAPSIFQRAMNQILGPVVHKCAEVYIDDVIVWGVNKEECLRNLRKVLELIDAAGVKLKRSKCSFLTETVNYLGHEISRGEIRPSPQKMSAVENFRTPNNVHELRQFLGLASYFRKFVKGFATIACPLTELTKKNVPWSWGPQQQNAMQTLKEILTSDPVLTIFNPERETQIHTDASKQGLGAMLLQKVKGDIKVVACASRKTTAAEENYHSFELEALAVVFAIQKFKVYVTGIKFLVVTDCSALRLAWTKRDLSPRIARWWLDLQEFDFEVEHRPGTSMAHVDALSRNPVTICHIEERELIDALQQGDEEIQNILQEMKRDVKSNSKSGHGILKDFKIIGNRLCRRIDDGTTRPVLPKSAKWHILKIYHDDNGHMGLEKCLEAIKAKYWFSKMRRFVEKYVNSCINCQFTKKPTGKQPGFLHPIPRSPVPFDTLHIDHLGPFCKSNGKTYIFAIIDGFTKFVWLEAVAAANARGAITSLNKLAQVFGYPARIISDRGAAFTSREFKQFCENCTIKHVLNAVASPRANGQVERLNRTILASLTAHMGEDRKGWDVYLPKVQLGINSTISGGTGKSPLELLCCLRPRLAGELNGPTYSRDDVESMRADAAKKIELAAVRMSTRYNKHRRTMKPLPIGTLVMVERKILRPGITSGKLVPRYAGPYKVTAVLPNDRYKISSPTTGKRGYRGIIAGDKIKKWVARQVSSEEE